MEFVFNVSLLALFVAAALAVWAAQALGFWRSIARFQDERKTERAALPPYDRALRALRAEDPCEVGLIEADEFYAHAAQAIAARLAPSSDPQAVTDHIRRVLSSMSCDHRPSDRAVERVVRRCLGEL
jgi:hypothetical protein